MQDKDFSLNMELKYVRSSLIHIQSAKPEDTKSDHSELDHAEPN